MCASPDRTRPARQHRGSGSSSAGTQGRPRRTSRASSERRRCFLPRTATRFMVSQGFGRTATRGPLPALLELVASWGPDVVVHESHDFAGAFAAECHGIAHVRVAPGLASSEDETLSLVSGPLAELRFELGRPADPDGAPAPYRRSASCRRRSSRTAVPRAPLPDGAARHLVAGEHGPVRVRDLRVRRRVARLLPRAVQRRLPRLGRSPRSRACHHRRRRRCRGAR
jgi:hypothetical protein